MTGSDTPPDVVADAPARDHVAVCICTHRRAEVLVGLLERLVAVATDCHEVASIGVVVVDDDPAASARSAVEAFAGAYEGGLAYVVSGAGNISVARNHALDQGGRSGDWLALIDDDCLPDPGWVLELVRVRRARQADCVSGACVDVPPPGAPRWLSDEPFLDELDAGADGEEIQIGPLKNTMVSARFLADHGVGFDPALGRVGGEDVMFFHHLQRAGARHHFAPAAVVRELVPVDRATLRYQLGRRFWYGNTEALTSIASGRASRMRMVVSGAKLGLVGVGRPIGRVVRWRSPQWRFALSEVLRSLGRVLGALGIEVRHR